MLASGSLDSSIILWDTGKAAGDRVTVRRGPRFPPNLRCVSPGRISRAYLPPVRISRTKWGEATGEGRCGGRHCAHRTAPQRCALRFNSDGGTLGYDTVYCGRSYSAATVHSLLR